MTTSTTWTELDALHQRRTHLISEARRLDAEAGAEPTAEQSQRIDRVLSDVDDLDQRIAAVFSNRRTEDRAAFLENLTGSGTRSGHGDAVSQNLAELLGAGERGGTRSVLMSPEGIQEHRDILTSTSGANVITEYASELMSVLTNGAPVWDAARTVITDHTRDVAYPNISAAGTAVFLAEGAALSENDPTLTTITLEAYKVGQLMQVSFEAEHEVAEALGIVARDMTVNLGVAADTQFVLGDGTTEPQGLATGLTGSSTVTGVTFPTADNLVDALHAVGPQYRKAGRMFWVFNDATIAGIRKLKDSQNQYLWQPGLAAGQPDELLGYPVIPSADVATVGANAKCGFFVDMDRFIVRQTPVRLERSTEYAFANDLATYRAVVHVDSIVTDAAAGVALQNEAS